VAAIIAAAVALRHRGQAPANHVGYRAHFFLEARRQMSVALELPLETWGQAFTASVIPALVALIIAILTVAVVVTILAIVAALVIFTVLRLKSSEC
jgi:hypothetical protein